MIKSLFFVVLAILNVLLAWLFLSAWVCKAPWLNYLWMNVSYILHQEWFVVPLVTLIYLAAFLFVRWHLIGWPSRLVLYQQIGAARLRLTMETPGNPENDRRIVQLQNMLTRAAARLDRITFLDRILWTRGQEIANTRHVSEVERELAVIQPETRVKVRLEAAEQELRASKSAGALADLIHTELDVQPAKEDRLRGLLYEALGTIYASSDDENDIVLTWHNKTLWLTAVGILLIILLEGVKRGGAGLFAVGAAGGFLSRLMRSLKSDNVPTDYGSYWTTLFLSPLVGALAGWTGILLIQLAVHLGALGQWFAGVSVESTYTNNFTLALAFLLGFSERLFDGILKPVEDKITKDAEPSSSSSSSSPRPAPSGSSSSFRSGSLSPSSSSSVSSRSASSVSSASSSSSGRPSSSSSSYSSSSSGSI